MDEEFVVEGIEANANIPNIGLHQYLIKYLRKHGDKNYIIESDTDTRYTFRQLLDDSLRLSQGLRSLGIKEDDVIGVCGYTTYEMYVAVFASIMTGIVVAIRGTDTATEVKNSIEQRGIRWMLISSEQEDILKAIKPNFGSNNIIVFGDSCQKYKYTSMESLINENKPLDEKMYESKDWSDEVCFIIESSGTTGPPKGVLFTHRDLVTRIHCCTALLELSSDDVIACHTVFSHATATLLYFNPIVIGCQIVIYKEMTFDTMIRNVGKYKATAMFATPSFVVLLTKGHYEDQFQTVRTLFCGGQTLAVGVGAKFMAKYKVKDFRQIYAMTETLPLISISEIGSKNYDSVGKVFPGCRIKVVDPNTGRSVGAHLRGEIWFKGPIPFSGYHNNVEATKKLVDDGGWIHTGDIGYYDETGHFYIVDRIKELIKSYGMQVAPSELERVLIAHEAVKEAVVIGIPDEVASELPAAVVVLKDGYDGKVTTDDLLKHVDERITKQKRLTGGIIIVNSLPKTDFGKIPRRKILEEFIGQFQNGGQA